MKTPLFSTIAGLLGEMAFPRGCACCGKPILLSGEEACFGLCSGCRDRLLDVFSGDPRRCAICGKPLISERETCMACRRGPERSFDGVFSLFPYQWEYRKILRAYKFGSRRNLGRFLRECLVRAASSPFWDNKFSAGQAGTFAWVPVPPRPGKIRKTGWDQVEYLAKLLEKDGGKVCRCLRRLSSDTQKVLGREKRRVNLRGKIQVREDYRSGKKKLPETALVFDDVYTTGSTMDACAEALKSAGTVNVYGICLFYD
ncbi:MAG: double zinc ribbon domain-containing protein [Treponema sp.]|jgi:ComF family protein|nr:double zinc ribbon domain-containing protein [Treponema sp.]